MKTFFSNMSITSFSISFIHLCLKTASLDNSHFWNVPYSSGTIKQKCIHLITIIYIAYLLTSFKLFRHLSSSSILEIRWFKWVICYVIFSLHQNTFLKYFPLAIRHLPFFKRMHFLIFNFQWKHVNSKIEEHRCVSHGCQFTIASHCIAMRVQLQSQQSNHILNTQNFNYHVPLTSEAF